MWYGKCIQMKAEFISLSIFRWPIKYHIYSLVAVENSKGGEDNNIVDPFHNEDINYWYMLPLKEENKTEKSGKGQLLDSIVS